MLWRRSRPRRPVGVGPGRAGTMHAMGDPRNRLHRHARARAPRTGRVGGDRAPLPVGRPLRRPDRGPGPAGGVPHRRRRRSASHSLHAYFIRRGDAAEPVRYEVDRVRNGRSFVTRTVDRPPGRRRHPVDVGLLPGRRGGPEAQIAELPDVRRGPTTLPHELVELAVRPRHVPTRSAAGPARRGCASTPTSATTRCSTRARSPTCPTTTPPTRPWRSAPTGPDRTPPTSTRSGVQPRPRHLVPPPGPGRATGTSPP